MPPPPRLRNRVQQAFRPTADHLARRVVHGAAFTFLGIALRTGVTVASMAVLARLLRPADFGHLAMATVVTELAAVFSNFGFGSILIQRPRVSRIQIDTMHWSAAGLGLTLTTLVFVLSYLSGHFFQNAMVGPLLRVLCLCFILEELTMVPRSLLARRMQFKLDFLIQAATQLSRVATAIVMALQGMGVWSLVAGALAGSVVQACAYWALSGYWPRPRFSRSFLRSTWRTNGGHFGNGILFFINSNLDLFLVGRRLGAALLGQYQNARSLTDEIRSRMVQPLQRVLFPAFSAIQNDTDRFREGILRSGRLLALAFIPMGLGVAAVAPELVRVLYGDQWLPMIPILQVIAIATGLSAPYSISSPIFNATNRVGLSFKLFLASTLITIALMLYGSQWGLMGVAWSRLALAGVGLVFFRISLGLVGMRTRHIWQIMGPPSIAAGAMWWLIGLLRDWVQSQVTSNASAQLGCLIGLGAAAYLSASLVLSAQHMRDARVAVSKLRGESK